MAYNPATVQPHPPIHDFTVYTFPFLHFLILESHLQPSLSSLNPLASSKIKVKRLETVSRPGQHLVKDFAHLQYVVITTPQNIIFLIQPSTPRTPTIHWMTITTITLPAGDTGTSKSALVTVVPPQDTPVLISLQKVTLPSVVLTWRQKLPSMISCIPEGVKILPTTSHISTSYSSFPSSSSCASLPSSSESSLMSCLYSPPPSSTASSPTPTAVNSELGLGEDIVELNYSFLVRVGNDRTTLSTPTRLIQVPIH
jgi:hypothetical protein